MPELEERFIRRESGRIVAALTRIFGVHNLALAEDVTQDTFCRALEVWKVRGVPENPSAWLMATAKHRALDVVRREGKTRAFAPEMGRLLETEWTLAPVMEEAFFPEVIRDAELRMMFSCCHPLLAEEAQLALVLNVLCGFGADEIASSLLMSRAAIEKRIARAKKTLTRAKRLFDLADAEFDERLSTVRRALYLLFNEGYHGASASAVRTELCEQALRLTLLLCEHPPADAPKTRALAALMCLYAARLSARVDGAGDLNELAGQDRGQWDPRLTSRGLALFEQSASGTDVSPYHVEAAIAVAHASAASFDETDWPSIVSLYDRLMAIAPSPVVALNRAIAVGQIDAERGLRELCTLPERGRLSKYPFYPAAMGDLELRRGHVEAARRHFSAAHELARNDAERRFLEKKLAKCAP